MTMLTWSDRRPDGGGIYAQNINSNGTLGNITGITPVLSSIPQGFSLSQNYPNPFNPATKLFTSYHRMLFKQDRRSLLTVYDITGKELKLLVNQKNLEVTRLNLMPLIIRAEFISTPYFIREIFRQQSL